MKGIRWGSLRFGTYADDRFAAKKGLGWVPTRGLMIPRPERTVGCFDDLLDDGNEGRGAEKWVVATRRKQKTSGRVTTWWGKIAPETNGPGGAGLKEANVSRGNLKLIWMASGG